MVKYLNVLAAVLAATASAAPTPQADDAAPATCTNPSVRKPWSKLTADEKASYIQSTLCLMDPEQAPSPTGYGGAKSRWDDLTVAHVAQIMFIHGVGAFLPWHRYITIVHENLLRNECGYTGPLPYWDMQGDNAEFDLVNSSIWGADYFGSPTTDSNNCVVDGAFTGLTIDLKSDLSRGDAVCLRRIPNQSQYANGAQRLADACLAFTDFGSLDACLSFTPHFAGHGAIGGTMSDVSLSIADPLFYLHHTNLDRLWWVWQSQDAARLSEITGANVATSSSFTSIQPASLPVSAFLPYFNDGGNVTTLNHVLWVGGAGVNVTIGDVMDITGPVGCTNYE